MSVINHTWNFIFVHIPKCGGTAVSRALQPLCTWRDLQLGGSPFGELVHQAYCGTYGLAKHSCANEIVRSIGPREWMAYTSFTVVRHPIERTFSTYRYLSHHKDHYKFMQEVDSFSEFLDHEHWKTNGPDRMFMPQWRWLRPELKKDAFCNRWLKLETLGETLRPFLHECGVPKAKLPLVELGSFNKSPRSIPIEMRDRDRERILERYEHDFLFFDYDTNTDNFAQE